MLALFLYWKVAVSNAFGSHVFSDALMDSSANKGTKQDWHPPGSFNRRERHESTYSNAAGGSNQRSFIGRLHDESSNDQSTDSGRLAHVLA